MIQVQIAKDVFESCFVSTIDLGYITPEGSRYETMVFATRGEEVDWRELDYERYRSETGALAGHAFYVDRAAAGLYDAMSARRWAETDKLREDRDAETE